MYEVATAYHSLRLLALWCECVGVHTYLNIANYYSYPAYPLPFRLVLKVKLGQPIAPPIALVLGHWPGTPER